MIIRIEELAYYHPSNANWSYHIFYVSSDKNAFKVTSTFGADYRLKEALEKLGHKVETHSISDYEAKYKDIKNLLDIDNNLQEVIDKLTK